jgi:site-specific DNA-methyltransferase (adenine-specific)
VTKLAEEGLAGAGFTITARQHRVPKAGLAVSFAAADGEGQPWFFDVAGPFTSNRGGLARIETVWRTLGRVAALRGRRPDVPVVVLTTQLPRPQSEGDLALRAAGPDAVFDVIDLRAPADAARLERYAGGQRQPAPGFWPREAPRG